MIASICHYGVSGSLVDAVPPRNFTSPTGRRHFVDPLALHGSIFRFLLSIRRASKNYDFLASPQNFKNQRISQTWEAHVAIVDQKT